MKFMASPFRDEYESGLLKRFAYRVELLIMGLLLTLTFGASHAGDEKREPSAVVVSGSQRFGVVRNNSGWRVDRLPKGFEIGDSKRRLLRVTPAAIAQLEKCFVELKCVPNIGSGPVEVDEMPEGQSPLTDSIQVHRLSNRFAAVVKPSYAVELVFFLDLSSGQVFDLNASDRVLAFSKKLGGVYFSDCPPRSVACDIGFMEFGSQSKAFVCNLNGRIWDLRVDGDDVLALFTKNTSKSPNLLDRVAGAMGHPPSRQEWFIATLDSLHEVKETKLTDELTNAWGKFVCKWCYRGE